MDTLLQILGRLHPLIVHLPIGFVILGLLVLWINRKNKTFTLPIAQLFLWGGMVSVLSCISGYLLYTNEGYAFDTIKGHLWFGVATTIFCFVLYLRLKPHPQGFLTQIPLYLMGMPAFVLLSVTGHKGGNLTHGEGYLTEPLPPNIKKILGIPVFEEIPIALNEDNWENTQLYREVVHPILNNKCVSCHGPKQAKGDLRLHDWESIVKGGEQGSILKAHNPEESELYTRLVLPTEDEGHMPPKEKEQLTKEETAIIKAWIEIGHPSQGSFREVGIPRKMAEPFFPKNEDPYPDVLLEPLPLDSLSAARSKGLHVEFLGVNSPWLRVSAINGPHFANADAQVLHSLRNHIVELNLGGTQVNDSIYGILATWPHLTRLKLDHTAITDHGLEQLGQLQHLKFLHLMATEVSPSVLEKLKRFPVLEKVYVFGTPLPPNGPKTLRDGQLQIDYGGYQLPPIASDSITY